MKRKSSVIFLTTALIALLGFCPGTGSEQHLQKHSVNKMTRAMLHAHGTFEVQLTPMAPDDAEAESTIGRMTIDKKFSGDLEGSSKGQMLAYRSDVEGSAGYVAVERVTGSLGGKKGSFVLQHSGTMTRGEPQLTITVVPDSGTEQLVGLAGTMAINIIDGAHEYDLDYTLPEAP